VNRRIRLAAIAVIGGINLWLVLTSVRGLINPGPYSDFVWLTEAAGRITAGDNPYAGVFRWSPLAAWALVPLDALGIWGWRALHFAALLLLPRKVALLVAVSFPFWWDVELGNVNVFVLVAAWWAMTGKPWAFLVLAVLIPRPMYLPLLGWLLWKQPRTRVPFAILAAGSLLGAFLTGWGDEWLAMLTRSDFDMTNDWNLGPSRVFGVAWIPVGLVLAAFLTWKGRLGLASLAASPYLLPYYFLMGFLELPLRPARVEVALEVAGQRAEGGGAPARREVRGVVPRVAGLGLGRWRAR
jgi:hypothetical protein